MLSTIYQNKVLDHILREKDIWVGLHTRDPGRTGANEVVGNGYARQLGMFRQGVEGISALGNLIDFMEMPSATVTHIGLWDAVMDGTFIWSGALERDEDGNPRRTNFGDFFRVPEGNVVVSID